MGYPSIGGYMAVIVVICLNSQVERIESLDLDLTGVSKALITLFLTRTHAFAHRHAPAACNIYGLPFSLKHMFTHRHALVACNVYMVCHLFCPLWKKVLWVHKNYDYPCYLDIEFRVPIS